MMDPDRRIADTTVVRLENERDALKREVKRHKAFVDAFDAWKDAFETWPNDRHAALWNVLLKTRAALDAVVEEEHRQ